MRVGSGKFVYEVVEPWGRFPPGRGFGQVSGLAVGPHDRLYVLANYPDAVFVFDRDGGFLASWGEGTFKWAHGICVGPDESVYCVDQDGHALRKYTTDGKPLLVIEHQPADTGYVHYFPHSVQRVGPPFNRPTGVALSSAGDIYVTDGYGNARVHVFAPDGRLRRSWGEPGDDGPGRFRVPHAIWIDGADRVYVADRENHRIQVFSPHGEFLFELKGFVRPTGLCVDGQGMIYVSELGLVQSGNSDNIVTSPDAPHGRITIRSQSRETVAEWGPQDPAGADLYFCPHAIAMDSRGDLYMGQVSRSYSRGKAAAGRPTLHKYVRV